MNRGPSRGVSTRAISAYFGGAAVSTAAACLLLRLWKADLHVPFAYHGDALLYTLVVKSTLDHGWWWINPSVGAPGALELYDFPFAAHDTVHLLIIKAMSLFSSDWALLFNLYFLLGFPLITLSAMAVLRHFRVGYGPAIVASVLYAFLPSRLLKGEGHIFLDVFYEVPLAVLVLLWVCGDKPPLVRDLSGRRWPRLELRAARSWSSLLICALLATTSFYYAAFAGFLVFAGGLWGSAMRRSAGNAIAGSVLACAIVLGLAGSVVPSIAYHARHGSNAIAERYPSEADTYGLRIAQLLLPADGHRLQVLLDLKERYNNRAALPGESGSTSLGLVGGAGFLLLLGVILSMGRLARGGNRLLAPLAALNLMAVLLATIGGFGSLFALLVHPQVRGYLRINVYIGFFSLFAVALVLDWILQLRPTLALFALPALLVLGLLDQSTWHAIPRYADTKREYESDAALVRKIEATVPAGAMVFELPYLRFPEVPGIRQMDTYDPIRPYLHSHALRWSFPTVRDRVGDRWAQDVTNGEPSEVLRTLADIGFGGVLVDRDGYADQGSAIERTFRGVLGVEPLVSENRRLAYFDIQEYARRRRSLPAEELAYAQAVAAHPLSFSWTDGCFGIEYGDSNRPFRWCRATGTIGVRNDAPFARKIRVRMSVSAAESPATLTLEGLVSEKIHLAGSVPLVRVIDVPPGEHLVRFDCDGKRADAPGDPRTLIWHVDDFTTEEIRAP
jgi:hypothetical protein